MFEGVEDGARNRGEVAGFATNDIATIDADTSAREIGETLFF